MDKEGSEVTSAQIQMETQTMFKDIPVLAMTPGEPSGIGPECTIRLAHEHPSLHEREDEDQHQRPEPPARSSHTAQFHRCLPVGWLMIARGQLPHFQVKSIQSAIDGANIEPSIGHSRAGCDGAAGAVAPYQRACPAI